MELCRAQEALQAAEVLLEKGLYADSVSRAYYGMLHSAQAVLLTEGLEPQSHGGVAHYLNLRFVRRGEFPPRQARLFSRMQAEREAADYDRTALFTRDTAEDVLRSAQEFCQTCREVLEARGYLPR
jgi:uncharacterized protein (UPF0332 family)